MKFYLKEFTGIIQAIYLTSDKNNFQINFQLKNKKIIRTKNCLKESIRIIQVIYLMSDTNNFQINLIAKNTKRYSGEILSKQINNICSVNLSDE